jgi:hypothetical protein
VSAEQNGRNGTGKHALDSTSPIAEPPESRSLVRRLFRRVRMTHAIVGASAALLLAGFAAAAAVSGHRAKDEVRAAVAPLIEKDRDHEGRIKALEADDITLRGSVEWMTKTLFDVATRAGLSPSRPPTPPGP